MPDITFGVQTSIDVEILVAFDAQWDHFEVFTPEIVPEADVEAYYTLVTSDFPNTDVGGFARKIITFEDLGTRGAKEIFIRVIGVKPSGQKEGIPSVNASSVKRSNTILFESVVSNIGYPVKAQVPFGFDAEELEVESTSTTAATNIFFSFDGVVDHGKVSAGKTVEFHASQGKGSALGQRLYLRVQDSVGAPVQVRVKRPDIDRI